MSRSTRLPILVAGAGREEKNRAEGIEADRMRALSTRIADEAAGDAGLGSLYGSAKRGVKVVTSRACCAQLLAAPSAIHARMSSISSAGSGSPLYGMRAPPVGPCVPATFL